MTFGLARLTAAGSPSPRHTMSVFDSIEKLITEHGSAAILREHLALAKSQYDALERQVKDAVSKVIKLEAQLEIDHRDHRETKQELQRLKDEHAEEIRIHNMVEFRRGKRTGGKWMGFCPKCHMPVTNGEVQQGAVVVICTGCEWFANPDTFVHQMIRELGA
jgi:hypothetical protein